MKAMITAAIAVLPLGPLKNLLLNLLGHKIHRSARIGFSWLRTDDLRMGPGARVGHLNLVRNHSLWMGSGSTIKLLNRVTGPFHLRMGRQGFIGTLNTVIGGGAPQGLPIEPVLRVGPRAELTTLVSIDCTENVTLREGVVLAGRGVQIWTHGFAHREGLSGRELLRGSVKIGRNVYVGAMSCINLGVEIADDVTIGSLTSVSKSLPEPGVYVSAPIRHIASTAEARLARMDAREGPHGVAYYRR